jgi:cell wall-associated NlpC family hydrolase
MYLKRNAFVKMLLLFVVFIVIAACTPKKIRLYDVSDNIRSNVVASALALQGKPYKNGAKGPDAFDCSGLVYHVFKQYRPLPPPAEAQSRAGQAINRDSLLPGDLVFFKIEGDFHVGIVISRGEFVHASKSRVIAIDNLDTNYWRKRLVGYRSVF